VSRESFLQLVKQIKGARRAETNVKRQQAKRKGAKKIKRNLQGKFEVKKRIGRRREIETRKLLPSAWKKQQREDF